MFVFAYGRLFLDVTDKGVFAYDGVDVLRVLSPGLIFKTYRHRNKITVFIAGWWLQYKDTILVFVIDRKNIYRYVSYGERFTRKMIKGYENG